MDPEERLRRALAAFGGGDVWDLVDAALAAAARNRPAELRARRDAIVEQLYTGGRCGSCDAAAVAAPEPEADALGVQCRIMAIKSFLDPVQVQSDDELVSLLQELAGMYITYNALQATDVGRYVNGLRKHPSAEVRRLVKQLIRKWKETVDDWVRLHNSGGRGGGGGGSIIIADGDSPEKIQGKNQHNAQVSEFQYSPSPKRQNSDGLNSERAKNGIESTIGALRRATPAPMHHNTRQNNINNNNHHLSTTTSSAPPRMVREQKDIPLDLDSARKRRHENYKEAQNAKRQRTIRVMDVHDIPMPKNAFIRKGASGGLPERHR